MSLKLNQKVRVFAIDESGKQNEIHRGYIVDYLTHVRSNDWNFVKVFRPATSRKQIDDTSYDVESSSSEYFPINSKRCKVIADNS